ncbi:MAG: MG2 domain-containing protein [Janthinobacterium lividum]
MPALFADSAAPGPNPPYAPQWKKIDALLAKDQTATAAPLVERVYQQARQENNSPAYVRALLYKIRLLSRKENDADEKAIALLEADLKTAQFPARPILHSLLASLYTRYYQQHRYQLYQRTAGAEATTDAATAGRADGGTSLATWDARRLGAAIVRHYEQSVEDEPERQLTVSLASLGDLATGGDAEGRALRPSLYDLLAQRAIEGLQNQELYLTRPEQQFSLSAYPATALFGPAADFAGLRLLEVGADTLNHELYTLRLLQRLTARRLSQPQNPAALADVDLQRLDYLHELTQNTDAGQQYEPALTRAADTYKLLPISTEFMARRVALHREADPVAAVALARAAEARFPASRGAARARELREGIERAELPVLAAAVVVPGQPWRLDLTARNVTALHAWAYRVPLGQWQSLQGYNTRPVEERYAKILKTTLAATWAVPVPAHPADYREQHLSTVGAALPVGYYVVVISTQPTPSLSPAPGTATSFALLGASELSAVSGTPAGTPQLLVLQRQSGQPLAGVSAQATYSRYSLSQGTEQQVRTGDVQTTAATGIVSLPALRKGEEGRLAARIWRGRDTLQLGNLNTYYNEPSHDDNPDVRCFLFTDRAIYRPGQTVYFKGVVVESQRGKNRLLTQYRQEISLQDPNSQTVQSLSFTTSAYGSFNGSLVLPTGRLNGNYSLSASDGDYSFKVEDYKRPTFLVTLDSVGGRPQLGQPLAVPGRAQAYAGPPVDGARVSYRVTRRELWPMYDYGYRRGSYRPNQGQQEIAHGTTTADAEGRFAITFTPPAAAAAPGRGGWQPGFVFEVTADVTDGAGETRSATRSISIGHNPLSLRLVGPAKVDKAALAAQPAVQAEAAPFHLLSTNATGEALHATGTLRILARHYRPNPPGVPGPLAEDDNNEGPTEVVSTLPFDTKASANLDLRATLAALPTGRYRLEATGPDSAQARLDFVLYDSQATTVPFATPDWFVALDATVEPGQPASILLGSSEANAHILLEVERGGQLLRQEWLTLRAGEQRRLTLPSGPADARGPLYVHTTQVRDNHLYRHDATVQVASTPQPLSLSIATFRNKLQPGERETWRVTIHQANGQAADAELLATLYDQSLDFFQPHHLMDLETQGDYYPAQHGWHGDFSQASWIAIAGQRLTYIPTLTYPQLNTWDALAYLGQIGGRPGGNVRIRGVASPMMAAPAPAPMGKRADGARMDEVVVTGGNQKELFSDANGLYDTVTIGYGTTKKPDLSTVPTRTDFRETAFWQPALHTDKNGDVVLEFQMPEAVTRWQLLALAHDKNLHTGRLARQLVTQKQVQITPNAPRFLRQGDTFTFPAKVANLTDHATSGTAQLVLLDAATGQDITSQLLKSPAQQAVAVPAHQSASLGWELSLPATFAPVAVTYRVVVQTSGETAEAGKPQNRKPKAETQAPTYSDGEENTLPVLTNRILVTESLPLPLVGPATRSFELTKLTSTTSPTRQNYGLTLEMTANPAWYAVQSLPYLMEYPYECSEQTFSRLYANLLAAQILKSNPRFKAVLAEWTRQAQSGTAAQKNALASKLEQNQELKNLLLQETPWVRDAQGEDERLARLSTLFDETRLQAETARALARLAAMQLPDGSFPWFERMPADRYITQLIVAGFGKLHKLGAFDASRNAMAQGILQKALHYLDQQLTRDYADLRQQKAVKLTDNHLSDNQIQALYARSFWPQPAVATPAAQAAQAYYRGQAATYWLHRTRYLQAQAALALYRDNKTAPATQLIMRALSENALHSPELGMYWQDVQHGYSWREAPTETQATLIEAYDEINHDQKSVDELKLWLLKQKHTQHWESTRATADACYALLLRGTDWLAPTQPLQVSVGGQAVRPEASQAGTGYYKTSWAAAEVQPAQGTVVVTKSDAGVAWGALYWQYFEDLDKVTTSAAALSVERQLYRETRTAAGPQLEKLTSTAPLRVGDALVVRLVLRTDRALEYVHLKD